MGTEKHDVLEPVLPLYRILAIVRTIFPTYILHTFTAARFPFDGYFMLAKNDKRKLQFSLRLFTISRAHEHIVLLHTHRIHTFFVAVRSVCG